MKLKEKLKRIFHKHEYDVHTIVYRRQGNNGDLALKNYCGKCIICGKYNRQPVSLLPEPNLYKVHWKIYDGSDKKGFIYKVATDSDTAKDKASVELLQDDTINDIELLNLHLYAELIDSIDNHKINVDIARYYKDEIFADTTRDLFHLNH